MRFLFLSSLFFTTNILSSQSYTPGVTYFSANGYTKYIAGNLPLIISVPHGGVIAPAEIPDRTCFDAVYAQDAFTIELALEIDSACYELFGCHPHIIFNLLDRSKLDANRNLEEGACGDSIAEQSWLDFNNFIDSAKVLVDENFGKGFYIDLHGHGHTIQRVELGYLLYAEELQLEDAVLNESTYINYSSIKKLATTNLNDYTHAELLRGEFAFGTLLANRNYPSVPSQQDPSPIGAEAYFSGGYNTAENSSYSGGFIDGVQMECNYDGVRDNVINRKKFADSLALVLQNYLLKHYFTQEQLSPCSFTDIYIFDKAEIEFYPNPVSDFLYINNNNLNTISISLVTLEGKCIFVENNSNIINLQNLNPGIYIIRTITSDNQLFYKKIIKK